MNALGAGASKRYVGMADEGILHDTTAIHSLLDMSSDLSTFLEQSGNYPFAFAFSPSPTLPCFPPLNSPLNPLRVSLPITWVPCHSGSVAQRISFPTICLSWGPPFG